MDFLARWWKKRQRAVDIQCLWPSCKENSSDTDSARAAFRLHTMIDEAWSDMSDEEIDHVVATLR